MMKRNKAGTELKGSHSHWLSFIVLECAMQPARVEKAFVVISSCELWELQYQPAWRDVCNRGKTDGCS